MNEAFLLAALSPILITIGGIISWFMKSRLEGLREIEARAIEKRIKTYETIIEPFILMLNSRGNKKDETRASTLIVSLEYKKAAFNLVTFGSDQMVRAFNKMMQHFYKNNQENDSNFANNTMRHLCDFLLTIRKDLYNPKTKLKRSEAIQWLIKDYETFKID